MLDAHFHLGGRKLATEAVTQLFQVLPQRVAEGIAPQVDSIMSSTRIDLLTVSAGLSLFFATNAFVPDYLTHTGRGAMIGVTLAWFNGAQLIVSFVEVEGFFELALKFVVFGKSGSLRGGSLGV